MSLPVFMSIRNKVIIFDTHRVKKRLLASSNPSTTTRVAVASSDQQPRAQTSSLVEKRLFKFSTENYLLSFRHTD